MFTKQKLFLLGTLLILIVVVATLYFCQSYRNQESSKPIPLGFYTPKDELFAGSDLIEIANTSEDVGIIEVIVDKDSQFIYTGNLFEITKDAKRDGKFFAYQVRIKFTKDRIDSENKILFFDENKKIIDEEPWFSDYDKERNLLPWNERNLNGHIYRIATFAHKSMYVGDVNDKSLEEEIIFYFIGKANLQKEFDEIFLDSNAFCKNVSLAELLDFAKKRDGKLIAFRLRF